MNDSCPLCINELGEPYRVDGFRVTRVSQSMDRPEVFVRRLIGSVTVCERCVAGLESEDGRIPAWMIAEPGPVELVVRKLVPREDRPPLPEEPQQAKKAWTPQPRGLSLEELAG